MSEARNKNRENRFQTPCGTSVCIFKEGFVLEKEGIQLQCTENAKKRDEAD